MTRGPYTNRGRPLRKAHVAAVARALQGKPLSKSHLAALRRHHAKRINGDTIAERKVRRTLTKAGWRVFRHGWPDFLAVRGHMLRFIEVKTQNVRGGNRKDRQSLRFTPAQQKLHTALKGAGFEVETVIV